MLSNRLPLIRLGWIPLRLQLGIGVLRKQARLGSVNASTRGRRHALTLESSITAKRRNSCMRAELRRQAADVAAARCARRDATHNDAFEHLLWFH